MKFTFVLKYPVRMIKNFDLKMNTDIYLYKAKQLNLKDKHRVSFL